MRKALVAGIVSLGLLTGCSTNQGGYTKSADVERRLMQLSDVELVNKLGAPTDELQVNANSKVWTYRSDDDFINGGKCTVSVTVTGGEIVSASVNSQDRSWISFPLGACASIIGNLS